MIPPRGKSRVADSVRLPRPQRIGAPRGTVLAESLAIGQMHREPAGDGKSRGQDGPGFTATHCSTTGRLWSVNYWRPAFFRRGVIPLRRTGAPPIFFAGMVLAL